MENETLSFIITYGVGTAFGIWVGFKSGLKKGCDLTIEMLMTGKFLLYKESEDGEIHFIQPEKPAESIES